MENLIEILRHVKTNQSLQMLDVDELNEAVTLFEALSSQAKNLITELSKDDEEEDDDSEFIEIIIDGKPDLIKKDIEVLNISCNNFTTLPAAIYRLKKLNKLYLYNNNFPLEEKRKIRKRFPPKVEIHF